MEACSDCLRLEQRLRTASEDYVNLIVQHDQMIRDGRPEASILDNPIKRARRRRNAAARLLLAIAEHMRIYLTLFERGVGVVILHHALAALQQWATFEEITGLRMREKGEGGLPPYTYKHDVDFEL